MQGATLVSGSTSRYLAEIRRFPMLQADEECLLAKRWRENGDRNAAHKLVTSHLRLAAKLAMGYRGYGLPVSELISEGNIGLMQASKRFDPDKGFRFATYAMWWIKAAIQEYILRSWSVVKIGTTANQKKLFFNLRKAKNRISALEEGDLHPDQVKLIANRVGVSEQDVVDMNRRLAGDVSLNLQMRDDGDSDEWQDWVADESSDQEAVSPTARSGRAAGRRSAKRSRCSPSASGASSKRAVWRRSRRRCRSLRPSSPSRASVCARSKRAPSRRCRRRRKWRILQSRFIEPAPGATGSSSAKKSGRSRMQGGRLVRESVGARA